MCEREREVGEYDSVQGCVYVGKCLYIRVCEGVLVCTKCVYMCV